MGTDASQECRRCADTTPRPTGSASTPFSPRANAKECTYDSERDSGTSSRAGGTGERLWRRIVRADGAVRIPIVSGRHVGRHDDDPGCAWYARAPPPHGRRADMDVRGGAADHPADVQGDDTLRELLAASDDRQYDCHHPGEY